MGCVFAKQFDDDEEECSSSELSLIELIVIHIIVVEESKNWKEEEYEVYIKRIFKEKNNKMRKKYIL